MILNTGLDIAMFVPGLPIGPDSYESNAPLGGSETAGLEMARSLSERGHGVSVFCNCPNPGAVTKKLAFMNMGDGGGMFGVGGNWLNFTTSVPTDVLIAQRIPAALTTPNRSRRSWLWAHDLMNSRSRADFDSTMWNIDCVVTVSKWMKEQYAKHSSIDPDFIFASRNGLNMKLIEEAKKNGPVERDPNLLMYAARPERGLDILLGLVMPKLLEKKPDLRLVYSSYVDSIDPQMRPYYDSIHAKAKALGANVENLGTLTKKDLYELHRTASAYVYPTNFHEVSCISAMEAMALGNVFISSAIGALEETVGEHGILIGPGDLGLTPEEAGIGKTNPPFEIDSIARCPQYVDKFVENVLETLDKSHALKFIRKDVEAHGATLSWDGVAQDWEQELERQFKNETKSTERVVRHFLNEGNLWAADNIPLGDEGTQPTPEDIIEKRKKLQRFVDPQRAKKHYDDIASPNPRVAYHAWGEPRFQQMINILESKPEIKTILDVGCAHGGFAVGYVKQYPNIEITSIDIAKKCIDAANEFRDLILKKEEDRKRVTFHVEQFPGDAGVKEIFDLVVSMEFIEHTTDPKKTIDALEARAKPSGWVMFTVPYGPWEQEAMLVHNVEGCHISGLDINDCRDLLSQKEGFHITALPGPISKYDMKHNGWLFVQYQADHKPLGEINWERKRTILRPDQTISLLMITKNAANMLGRTLRSAAPFVDEIIVSDNGSTDDTRRILKRFNAKIIDGPDPTKVGFDTARNHALAHCSMDWVLWLDADEELLDGNNIRKYTKSCQMRGFSISQHHFSAVPPDLATVDIPVRLFRRLDIDGSPIDIKWYGHIHEHPERALNETAGRSSVLADVHISHDGYTSETKRQGRFLRNFGMMAEDRRKYPDRHLGKFFEMRDCTHLVKYLGVNPGVLQTPEIQRFLKEITIGNGSDVKEQLLGRVEELARKEFLGKMSFIQTQALEYYDEAVRMGGKGFEHVVALTAVRPGEQLDANSVMRKIFFASEDDLKIYLDGKLEAAKDHKDMPYG